MLFLTSLNISDIAEDSFSPTTIREFFLPDKDISPRIGTFVTRSKSSLSLKIGNIKRRKKINNAGTKKPIKIKTPYIDNFFGATGPLPKGLSINRAVGVANVFCKAISSRFWSKKV